MLDALLFVLYNRPYRRINKPQLVNTITGKNNLVEIEFSISGKEYLVRRGQRPTIFEIFQDGVLVNQDAAARDYQDFLEKQILKQNHRRFTQVVVLGSASYTPFMRLSTGQRREMIEDLLDLQVFSVMNSLLKDKVLAHREALSKTENEINITETAIILQEKSKKRSNTDHQQLLKMREEKIAQYRSEISQNRAQIAEIESKMSEKRAKMEDEKYVLSRSSTMDDLEKKLLGKQSKMQKQIDFYQKNDNCPTCRQSIDEAFKQQVFEKNRKVIEKVVQGLTEIQEEQQTLKTRISEIVDITSDIADLSKKISNLNFQINANIRFINDLEVEVEELKSKLQTAQKDDETAIDELKAKKKVLIDRKIELIEERELLSLSSQLLKDGGIKTRIIKQYVPIMNSLINKYLSSMQFMVQFELNENFEETLKSRFRDEFSYDSFSEGECKRIDLALLFAWRAIAKLRNSSHCNLLIMDEIFDGSLDGEGIEEVLNMMSEDSNVFIISHREQLLDKFDHVIRYEKIKNFTRMVA